MGIFFFFNDTATTEIYTLSLHDALPIWVGRRRWGMGWRSSRRRGRRQEVVGPARKGGRCWGALTIGFGRRGVFGPRSEEHTSELQSRQYLVCRLLLEKKKHQDQLPEAAP